MPKKPRETSDPLGKKLLQVLAEKGRADDLNFLAEALGVTVQSTYDYINHGRLSKDRYARLVEWSDRSLDWWFDIPSYRASSPICEYKSEPAALAWPVAGMSIDQVHAALTPEQRAEISGFIKAMLSVAQRQNALAA